MTDPLAMLKNKSNSQNAITSSLPNSLSDPRMKSAIDYVNSHGGNPKQAAINLCNEMGLSFPSNPIALIQQLMNRR